MIKHKFCSQSFHVKLKETTKTKNHNQTSVCLSFVATFVLTHPVLLVVLPVRASHSALAFLGATSHVLRSFPAQQNLCVLASPYSGHVLYLVRGGSVGRASDQTSGHISTERSTSLGLSSQFPYLLSDR